MAPRGQETATLIYGQDARVAPGRGRVVTHVRAYRPLTRSETVLPVISRRTIGRSVWLKVRLPIRPDGSTGWISANGVLLARDPWKIDVHTGSAHATVYRDGRAVRSFAVVVGKPSTPTPHGHFFVAEVVYEGGQVTGPWALATSAYSNVLQEFDGGPGQVALHGRIGLPDPLGTASSHGCVRFANGDIAWLAARVPAGTPIDITN